MPDRLAICYLSGDTVHADFAGCLVDLMVYTMQKRRLQIVRINTKSTIIADGRNEAVQNALAADCSHVLFLDSDMVFPQDTAIRLLGHDRPIVGATYMSRRPRPDLGQHVLLHQELNGAITEVGTGVRPVARMPTGCLLIRADALRVLPKPWFYFGLQTDGHLVGEDYAFCSAATKAGLGIFMDADLSQEIGHIGSMTLYPGMFGHAQKTVA